MLFFPRLKVSKKSECSPSWNGGTNRPTSPPEDGSSILITSAPRSASCSVAHGPAPNCSIATTRTSASGSTDDLRKPFSVTVLEDVEDDVPRAGVDVLAHAGDALLGRARD